MAEGSKPYKTKGDYKSKMKRETAKKMDRATSARSGYEDTSSQSKFKSKAKVPKG